jgi:hypothetical protein
MLHEMEISFKAEEGFCIASIIIKKYLGTKSMSG